VAPALIEVDADTRNSGCSSRTVRPSPTASPDRDEQPFAAQPFARRA